MGSCERWRLCGGMHFVWVCSLPTARVTIMSEMNLPRRNEFSASKDHDLLAVGVLSCELASFQLEDHYYKRQGR